ncbi:hypothetical protein [Vulcanisaeta thermophila]|uniref:hypothetical protein n=1 Tax=Vulcanisaeta thermophila TaxID=867917 RepID=UPI000853CCAC|nr:hypothetical protein [Vulcanisaeta thermophila]
MLRVKVGLIRRRELLIYSLRPSPTLNLRLMAGDLLFIDPLSRSMVIARETPLVIPSTYLLDRVDYMIKAKPLKGHCFLNAFLLNDSTYEALVQHAFVNYYVIITRALKAPNLNRLIKSLARENVSVAISMERFRNALTACPLLITFAQPNSKAKPTPFWKLLKYACYAPCTMIIPYVNQFGIII